MLRQLSLLRIQHCKLLAGEILADAAIKLYENPELITKANEELANRLQGDTYKCLIPNDVKPHVSKAD